MTMKRLCQRRYPNRVTAVKMSSQLAAICMFLVVSTNVSKGTAAEATLKVSELSPESINGVPLFYTVPERRPIRVLGIFPFNGFSHFLVFQGLMLELAKRGHSVTVVSPFPSKKPIFNYKDVDLSSEIPSTVGKYDYEETIRTFSGKSVYKFIQGLTYMAGADFCRKVLSNPQVQVLISGRKKFDIVFTEIMASECFLAVGHKLQVPTISMVSSHDFPWSHEYTGDIDNPAFFKHLFLPPSSDNLNTFWRRLTNAFLYVETKLIYYYLSTLPSEKVVRELFGDEMPSLSDLKHNVSLVMVNTDLTLFGSKPTVPRCIPVAGIHMQEPDSSKLPKDIKLWLDNAPSGVVYFSLGSLVRPSSMPPKLLNAFITAFTRLKPVRILWKYDSDAKVADIPDNVMIASWLPQIEVLGHPNVLTFITHGGLMSVIEAVYNGVPIVGMPLFADQPSNVFKFQQLGLGVYLQHDTIDADDIFKATNQTLYDVNIRQKMKKVSKAFRDRPMSPKDSAVWWTEYIVRHGGAPHLESPTATMPLWQYALLDVIAAILAVLLAAPLAIYFVIKLIIRRIVKRSEETPQLSMKRD